MLLAIFFSLVFRQSEDDHEVHELMNDHKIQLDDDEEYMHPVEVCILLLSSDSLF